MTAEETGYISTTVAGNVATVRVSRPPVNAINREVGAQIRNAFESIARRSDVCAVVLTGDEMFSAGNDIRELRGENAQNPHSIVESAKYFDACFRTISDLTVPTIAAINGYALGGGLMLTLYCDFRVAAEDVFLGLPEINLGGVPAYGMPRLIRLIGLNKAKLMVLTGDRVPAPVAVTYGLIDILAAPAAAEHRAHELAATIASKPKLTVAAANQTMRLGAGLPIDVAHEIDLLFAAQAAATADRAEALQAFLEKRSPNLIGR